MNGGLALTIGADCDMICGVDLDRSIILSPVLTDSKEDFASPVRFKLATLFLSAYNNTMGDCPHWVKSEGKWRKVRDFGNVL